MDLHPEDRVPVTIPVQGPSGATYLVRFGQGDWNAATLTDGKIEVVIKGPDFSGDSEGIGFIHCARF
jgi:hypothetical protein